MTSKRVTNASLWALAGGSAQYTTVFLLLVYLAHVLSPQDFGLMATVSIGLDLGLQIARWGQVDLLQQSRFRTDEARNMSFWISLLLGSAFSLLFVVSADPIAVYFVSPQLKTMFYCCAPLFIMSGSSVVAESVLRSEFRFRELAYRNTVSTIIGGTAAIALALLGQGALALAIQRLVQVGVASIWVWSAIAWRPALRRPHLGDGALIRQGAGVMIGTLLPLLVPRSIDLFVGFLLGPIQLGLMRVAFRLNDFVGQMIVLPLVGVATAQLSGLADDLAAMRRSYLGLTQASAAMMCPVLVGLALVAPEAVPIMFGAQWSNSIPLVQILSLLAFAAPINYHFSAAMVALGKSRIVLRQGVFQVLLGIVLAALAARYSLTAVVIAHVVRGIGVSLYNAADLRRYMKLPFRALSRSMAPPYVSTILMAAAVVVTRLLLLEGQSPILVLAVLSLVGGSSYAAAAMLGVRLGLWPEYLDGLEQVLPPRIWRSLPRFRKVRPLIDGPA